MSSLQSNVNRCFLLRSSHTSNKDNGEHTMKVISAGPGYKMRPCEGVQEMGHRLLERLKSKANPKTESQSLQAVEIAGF